MNSGSMLPDAVAGYYGLAALMTALHQRDRTGAGQHIDLSMMEANFTAVGDASLEFASTGHVRGRRAGLRCLRRPMQHGCVQRRHGQL